jgi:hypothetical protein
MVTWIKGVVAIVFLVFLLYKLISRLVSGLEGELLLIDVVKSAILLCWPLAALATLYSVVSLISDIYVYGQVPSQTIYLDLPQLGEYIVRVATEYLLRVLNDLFILSLSLLAHIALCLAYRLINEEHTYYYMYNQLIAST